MLPTLWHAFALMALPLSIQAITFNCEHVRVDKQSFDLSKLGGPKSVHFVEPPSEGRPVLSNTTFTLDICTRLEKTEEIPCSTGSRVCGVERDYAADGTSMITAVKNIAGEYLGGGDLNPQTSLLKNSDSNNDSEQEGLRVVLNGGKFQGTKQKAIIEFLCDKEKTGNEGFEESEALNSPTYGRMQKRDEDGDKGGDDEKEPELPDLDKGKSLQFVSYKPNSDDIETLRLTWRTKYACEGARDESPPEDESPKKGGWGFFTWLLIVVFLLAASYIIFGSWLNYNRYGARGWDLIPHGDAIRDLPYIMKDWIGGIMDRFRGGSSGGSRGGYSAV